MRRGNISNSEKSNDSLSTTQEKPLDINLDNKEKILEDNKQKNEPKSKDKLKVIILIIFTVVVVCITAGLLVYKSIKINGNKPSVSETNKETPKKETEDKKYLVSYKDMYYINPLTITDKYYEKKATKTQGSISAQYVEITGLQDKELQTKINKEIKDKALSYTEKVSTKQEYYANTHVQGNFNNILSIEINIYAYEGDKQLFYVDECLNYNLATGEKIKFLDLFASNTPINAILYDLEYERLAWDTDYNFDMTDEEIDKATNMDRRDTSEYEDKILMVINKYKKLDKDKIKFSVSPSRISIYLDIGENEEEIIYTIKQYKYIDYITLYKKFLTDKVVYESIPSKNILVFNDLMEFNLLYYKIETDNLFISIIGFDEEYEKTEDELLIKEYSKKAVDKKNELLNKKKEQVLERIRKLAKVNKNKGYMARFMPFSNIYYYDNEYGGEPLIYISLDGVVESMDIDYYNENAYRLLAAQNVRPRASVDDMLIGEISVNNTNIETIVDYEKGENILELSGYYTLDGTLVGTTYEEAQEYINKKYTKPEEPEKDKETEVEIYKEEQ